MKNERTLKVYHSFGDRSELPRIQLQGKWLRRAGFEPTNLIKVKIRQNELIIKNMQIKEVIKQKPVQHIVNK